MNNRLATVLGIVSLLLWSTTTAVLGTLIEQTGPFTFLTVTSGGAGITLWAINSYRARDVLFPLRMSKTYFVLGGGSYVIYLLLYACAIAMVDQNTVLHLALVNYLWPIFLVILSVPLLKSKARWTLLLPGLLLGITGICLARLPEFSFNGLTNSVQQYPLAFAMVLVASACWGGYSVLARRYKERNRSNGAAVFQLIIGICGLAIRFSIGEKSSDSLFETGTLLFLAYATFGLTAMGYFFWDLAMRYGSVTLLGSVSYALPVTNIMLACFFLDVPLTWNLTAGALTVVAGAVLSHKGISTRKTD